MGDVKKINGYQKLSCEESLKVSGTSLVRLRWVDTNKCGGIGEPNVRLLDCAVAGNRQTSSVMLLWCYV